MLQAFRESLRQRVGGQRYATWFVDAASIELVDRELRVAAASDFERNLIRKQFASEVQAAAAETLGAGITVLFTLRAVVEPTTETPPVPTIAAVAAPVVGAPAPSGSLADPFAGWVEGEANAEATLVVRRLIAGERGLSPVVFWGPSGAGKSRLVETLLQGLRGRDRRRRVQSISAEKFLVGFVEACRGGGSPASA